MKYFEVSFRKEIICLVIALVVTLLECLILGQTLFATSTLQFVPRQPGKFGHVPKANRVISGNAVLKPVMESSIPTD